MVTHDPFDAYFCKGIIFIKNIKIKIEITSNSSKWE